MWKFGNISFGMILPDCDRAKHIIPEKHIVQKPFPLKTD